MKISAVYLMRNVKTCQDPPNQGQGNLALSSVEQLKNQNIQSLKIDTHEENLGMQSLIKKLGYQYCGIIYTSYNAKRLAFEKAIYG